MFGLVTASSLKRTTEPPGITVPFRISPLRACAIFDTIGNAMIDRSKKITARFYTLSSGRRPVREWILGLPRDDRRTIGRDIQQVEFGWPIGMPYCRPLGQGLWEVRSNLAGNRMARVIFCITDGEMIPAA